MTEGATHSTAAGFRETVAQQISAFESARLVQRVAEGSIAMHHYHAILVTLFHQTLNGPYTFARAAVACSWRHEDAKEYLLRHAEEERSHWRWVLEDLKNTAYSGPSPRESFPHPTCEAFISFSERVAERMPVARLAIASVLEGIGASFGGTYGRMLLQVLGLKKDQARFFVSHGETDKVHERELEEVVAVCTLTPEEWGCMTHVAAVAGQFYRAMYNHESFA